MSLRRLALPLGLSVALHGLLVGLAWMLPSPRPFASPAGTGSLSLTVSLGTSRPPPRAPRPAEIDTIPNDIHPEVMKSVGPGIDVVNPAPVAQGSETPSPGGSGGGERTLLTAPAQARRIVYLLDRSVSMGPSGALQRAAEEIVAALRRLPADASFQLIAYNRTALPLLPGWQHPDADTLAKVESRLAALTASDGTHHAPALRAALSSQPDLVFLVTDAEELTPADVRDITRLNRGRAAIHVVELSRGKGERSDGPLGQLASRNGGTYRRVSPDF